ncbi:polysaccharide deacetylase family protein [Micromonospora sp. CPCC 206061]|uniref:polysaccharide deacetylase family protein n=1 Tax=Micromonospora sp. CPCC 206061 TaxID=3122410 RepID=UPI003FA578F4
MCPTCTGRLPGPPTAAPPSPPTSTPRPPSPPTAPTVTRRWTRSSPSSALTTMSQSQIQSQLSRTQQAIQRTAGVAPALFRPPYGKIGIDCHDCRRYDARHG